MTDKNVLESEVESALVRYAESKGCLCLKLKLVSGRGFPDRLIITPQGVHGYAETKRPFGGTLSPHQKKFHQELELKQCHYAAPATKKAAKTFVDYLLKFRG